MKPKKERVDPKYPAQPLEKLKTVLNSNKENDKGKEEKRRLKVFVNVCNMNTQKKKIDEENNQAIKEHSVDPPSDSNLKLTLKKNRKSFSREKSEKKAVPVEEAKSPDIKNKVKQEPRIVSQSLENFSNDQNFFSDPRRASYVQSNSYLNQSFTDAQMYPSQPNYGYYGPSGNNMMPPFGFESDYSQYNQPSANFYPDF